MSQACRKLVVCYKVVPCKSALTNRHFQKIYILSLAEHSNEHMKHLYLGFHSHFFSSIMIVAREHSPFLVACVRRQTKARNPLLFAPHALSRESLGHSHFAVMWIGLFNRLQPNHRHNGKEYCSVVSSRFFVGSIAWTSQKNSCGGDYIPIEDLP